MLWRKGILLLLLLQITVFARGKRRIRKRDAASDPLLAEIFKATDNEIKQSRERRPDRALDPGEELEAILTGFKHKDKHLLAENGPIKRDSGPDPRQNELDQQNIMLGLNAQNAVTRDHIPVPEDNTNLMQIPGSPTAAYNQDFNQNLMQLPEEQQQLNGIPAASFMPLQQNIEKKQDDSQVQVKNIIPGRPEQKQNDWANQPGVTVYLHEDKKSSIPIPVKTAALAVQAKGSFPLQMRKISPNMKIGAVVPHHAEYGETVESVTTKPEEIIAKKSEIPHSDSSKKSQVEKEATKESTTKNEVAKPVKSGDAAKKDFVQQPFMTQQQQQQAAFQTASQFGALQGGQDATFAQAVPVQAAAAVAAPQAVAPAVIAQPAAMAAPAAASAPAVPGEPCEDQYNTCADFAKNEYCVKYPAQMSIQCRKSCKFCVAPISPPLDAKQQIATAVPAAPAAPVAQNAAGAQALPVPSKSGATEESSGSGSGDSSGSGDAPGDVPVAKRSQFKGSGRPNSMYLPELGSGDDSGSGSGETFASGSEAAVVRQLASAQNIVSGVGQEATARSNIQSKNITVQQPIMKSFLKPKKNFPSANVKKSNIPQRPVSPLTAMDVENVNDDEDDASGSGSGSGSGDFGPQQRQEIERKSKIPVTPKKEQVSKKSKISKKSNIAKKPVPAAAPAPAAPLKLSSAYPRIDLRKIAAALARYEESALTLAGEYPRISSPDNDVVTRSQIPRPGNFLSSFNKLRQNIQIAKLVTQQNQKRFEIPKYLLVGDRISESGGIAQETSVPAADSVESIAERFAAAGLKPSMQEIYAETGKPMFESEAAKRMRIAKRKKKKFQKPVDPFEYLRNMPAGASMEPIIDPHAVSSTRESVSYPVYLMKVMPGSHKYVPASTRSKVNAIPKKAESNPNPAPVAPAKQSTQEENANAKSEFETGPGPELDSAAATEPIPDVNSAPQSEIELGPVQERPAPQAVSEPEPAPAVQQPEPAPAMQQPQPNGAENLRQERPALRTKMLSAFFHNKKSNDEAGSGSGEGEGGHARHDIAGEGSGSEFGDGGNAKAMSLQKLLQSEEGPRPEFAKMKENIQHFFDAPVAAQKEANYFQTTNPSNYLESNLAALTPESAVVAPNAFSTQSGLTAGASGSRITMSKTQETKWMRPDVGSELASIMPETNSQAETRTISTQAPVQTASMYRTPNPDSFIQAKSFEPSPSSRMSVPKQQTYKEENGPARTNLPTLSTTAKFRPVTTTESQPLTTTTTAAAASAQGRFKIEDSLYGGPDEPQNFAKANIEHEPTHTEQLSNLRQTPKTQVESPQSETSFFTAGEPKKPANEPALFVSGPPLFKGDDNSLNDNIKAVKSASRSNVQHATNGYTWQQYMPFGTGIWAKQSDIPTKSSTMKTTTSSELTLNENGGNQHAVARNTLYGSDTQGMFSASSQKDLIGLKATSAQAPSQMTDSHGSAAASQRQSIFNAASSGASLHWKDENAGTRSGIDGQQKNTDVPDDGSRPTMKPAHPNTELGIPNVVASQQSPDPPASSMSQISSIYQQAMRSQAPIGPQQVQFREPQRSPIIQPQTQMSPQAFIGQAPQQRPVQDLVQFKTQTIHQEMAHKKNLIKHKPDLDCGEGWEGASGDFGTFCYKFMNIKTVFDDAQAECQRLNSNLFSILNPYENRYLHDNFHEKLWIGYRDKGMDGSWNWTDGSRGIYTNWASEADDDNGQRRDCVILQADEGKWKDMPCTSNFRFLCKHKPGKCPKNWKKLNLNSVSGCYHMFQDKKTWEEAEQECENYDAHLVSILTEDEQTMIYQVYSSRNYWIGFNDKDSEGDWQWSDRLTSSYTNWDDKSPNNGGVSCAAFAEGGHWHDEPCMEKLPFICKRKGPKGEHILGVDDEGILKPVSRLLDKDEAARNEQINKGGPKPVVPSQFWPLLKNTKSGLSGNRPITVHGNLTSVPGGISLNGRDQYLDGGDFHGKCISDPDKCSKGLSVAIQVYLDDSVRKYKEPHCILDTSGGSKGFTIYVQKNKMHYKVITREKVWELATDITTNRWQEIVMTWHNYKGITLFVNGAFKDSAENGKNTGILREDATPRLLISRRATDLKPFAYTKMVIASLSVFSKQLSIEDVTYAFTFDDTVVANYRWLMPHMVGKKIPFASDIFVQKDVGDMDGGLAISGQKGWLEIKDYDPCLKDPSECHHGFALSFKLKLDQDVREYKKARYIIDSGGHQDGVKGVSVYILNDNLYFQVIMSPEEDIMIWTVRVPIYTVRWQRVVMTWRLDKGLWVYVDGAFRGLTKTPKTLPVVFKKEPELLVIGRKNVGPEFNGAQFGIGSLAIFSRFLTRKETEHVFAVKDNPFPGLIREVWRDIPGSTIAQLKSNPDYPNNPTSIEVIENFDAPFDIDKDYGSKLKGYFVAPETGNYTFYMSCSKSCELFTSGDEDTKNKTQIIQLEQATWHNQWNKYKNQTSKEINMIAGKYYYLEAVQKGEDSSDSLSVGVRLPSGRYQRPINKENLQWRLKGNPYAGVIREVWFDVPGYQVSDLTSDPNFPNNPSSTEVLDKMDAPYNIGDNYGSRLSGYFRAPETGDYRFYLASDTTGELWLSSDESESNLVKIVTLNGWTDHNQWLKFPEQRSDKVFLMVGKYYYIRAYQKADKLGDCASVAVELPSGHFEGPIKRKHLSWKLPGGKVGPGPNDLSEALPKPMGLYQLNEASLRDIISGDNGLIIHNIELTTGPDGVKDTAFEFKGKQDSYLEIPNDKHSLDAKNSITLLANIYPTGEDGPILNYRRDGWGVHIWQFDKTMLFVRFVSRDDGMTTQPLATRVLQLNSWNQVGASYDNNTGVSQLWHDGKMVKSRNIGQLELSTQYPIRVGAREGDDRHFKGKVACIQIYGKALTEQQIGELRRCPKGDGAQSDSLLAMTQAGSGSETGAEDSFAMENRVGEDTEEELAVNRCDPNPCINGAKCANDERKVDGYKCLCTSDFTGKNCQVSKPAAENPIVKRMNIPKYPKAVSSENYSKLEKKNPVKAEDEREDVFLLYQKLGCYKDDVKRHDLPNPVSIKATTQEECVRACALQDKGYAYFGLQNGKDCYCGKHYGKYGKVDNKLCAKTCEGNPMESCGGDNANQVFFYGLGTNYTVKTYTGNQFGSGTDAKIFLEVIGERGSSDFRQLDSGLSKFEPGSVDTKTFVLPDLGKLKRVRVLHDNSGAAPSWFLKKITITDEEGNSTEFPCNDWLSDTQGGGKLERELIANAVKTDQKSKS